MNVAKLRGKVVVWLLCAAATCVAWEDAGAAQRRAAGGASATQRRARRATGVRRARGRNVKRPAAAKKTTRAAPVVYGTRDTGAGVGPVGPAVSPNDARPATAPAPAQNSRVVRGGVITGKAISAPAPEYPPIARAARAQGTVSVEIIVDEEGRVISAKAVRGHPLLRQSAEDAVRQWRFTPLLLLGQPVRVAGTVTVNYALR